MVIRFVIRIFTYITNLICPNWTRVNITKSITDDADEYYSDDNSDDNSGDEIVDDERDENNNLYTKNIINIYPFKKSQSYTINRYYCGACSENIQYPQHMYSDKVYCSISCRNHQIKCDENSNKKGKHHSFSI